MSGAHALSPTRSDVESAMPLASPPIALLLAIKSPLQAFNAVEFCMRLKESGQNPELHAIVFCSRQNPALARVVEKILHYAGCRDIHVVPNLPSGKKWWCSPKEFLSARRFRRAVAAALATVHVDAGVLLGDYRSRECRHVAGCRSAADPILLDDGSATHQIARHRNNPRDPSLAPMFPGDDLRTFRLRILGGIRLPSPAQVVFFSHYPLGNLVRDTALPHTYPFWRKTASQRPRDSSQEILFLGMSHVEKRLTTLPRYLDALRKILTHYAGRAIIYRPHRDERPDKLDAVRNLGFTVLATDITPIELTLIEADTLPSEVSCIASSAIDNLAVIFQGKLPIRCFIPQADYCSAAMNGHFQDIIRHHVAGGLLNVQTTRLADA